MQYKSNKIINNFRKKLKKKYITSAWMQLSNTNLTELLCASYFDAVTFDFEHGVFSTHNIANLVRAAELKKKIKWARLPNHNKEFCSQVLDAGCDGIIIPNIKSAKELKYFRDAIYHPPKGKRGVGFSRENLFGKNFTKNIKIKKNPILVAMIENKIGVQNLKEILAVKELDAILIGPYDLSASLGVTGKFNDAKFKKTIDYIKKITKKTNTSVGMHVLDDNYKILESYIKKGFNFLPYCTDAALLNSSIKASFRRK